MRHTSRHGEGSGGTSCTGLVVSVRPGTPVTSTADVADDVRSFVGTG